MTIALPIPSAVGLLTYDDLVDALELYANRADLSGNVPVFITTVEAEMNRRLRTKMIRPCQVRSTLSITGEYVNQPVGLMDFIRMEVADYWRILPASPEGLADMKPAEDIFSLGDVTGPPKYYALEGSEIRFFPVPQTTYTASILYGSEIPALGVSNQSNWLLEKHPDVYLAGTLYYAWAAIANSEDRDYWLSMVDTLMTRVIESYPVRDYTPLRSEIGTLTGRVLA